MPGSFDFFFLSLQQKSRVSQQELRYLWAWVSLSATESVQEVLLEGHPSRKYLEEVHTLLLDVQQGLVVSRAEGQAGRACALAVAKGCRGRTGTREEFRPVLRAVGGMGGKRSPAGVPG